MLGMRLKVTNLKLSIHIREIVCIKQIPTRCINKLASANQRRLWTHEIFMSTGSYSDVCHPMQAVRVCKQYKSKHSRWVNRLRAHCQRSWRRFISAQAISIKWIWLVYQCGVAIVKGWLQFCCWNRNDFNLIFCQVFSDVISRHHLFKKNLTGYLNIPI